MTYEEALRDTIEVKRQLDEDFQNADFGILANLIDHYIEALEKQIPKRHINWLGKMPICPRCHRADYIKPLESYCKFCGQAIDWNQEDD